jgi:hypothetical protein
VWDDDDDDDDDSEDSDRPPLPSPVMGSTTTTTRRLPPVPPPQPAPAPPPPPAPALAPAPAGPLRELPCPVADCTHAALWSPGWLVKHAREAHGWGDPFDPRLSAHLEPLGFTQCGPACHGGVKVGAVWHAFTSACEIPAQHLDCPHYAQHKHRQEHRVLLGKEAKKVLPLLELNKNDTTSLSLAFHVRAVIEQMQGGATAGTATASAVRLLALLAPQLTVRPAKEIPPHLTQAQLNVELASKLLREPLPQVSRATRALSRGARFVVRTEADKELARGLFPDGEALPPPTFDETRWAAPRVGDADVNRLIKRKDKLSAAGLSGHGAKALKALRKRGRQWVTALRLISQAIADCWFVGTVAEEAIAACVLALVAKPNGGKPRPIGVGEAIVNLARSVCAGVLLRKIQAAHPLDFGLASTCGTEAAIGLVRAKLRSAPGNVAILLDFSNAFGCVQREAILRGALRFCPDAVPLLRAAYGIDGIAHFALADGSFESLRVSRGVRQGDSLGPLLYMLGMLPLLEEVREQCAGVCLSTYLDDSQLTGSVDATLNSFRYLKTRLDGVGLALNLSKCRVLAPDGLSEAACASFAEVGLTNVVTSAELLGSHVGQAQATREFLRDHLTEYLARLEAVLACKERGVPVQRLYKVLQYCCMASVTHHFRTIEPALTREFAEGTKAATLDALFGLLDRARPAEATLPEERLFAPRAQGGVGLPDFRVVRHAAFAASTKQTAHHVDRLLDVDDPEQLQAWLLQQPGFQLALGELARLAAGPSGAGAVAAERLALLDTLVTSASAVQRKLTMAVAGKMAERALATEPDPFMQAYTTSCRGPESWVAFDLFTYRQAELNDQEFRYQLLMRMGYPVFPGRSCCQLCQKQAGPSLVHGLNCKGTKQFGVTNRHTNFQNATVDAIRSFAGGKVMVVAHPPVYADHGFVPRTTPIPKGSKIIKGDFLVKFPATSTRTDQQKIVDVTVAAVTEKNLQQARSSTGAPAEAAELRKMKEVKDMYHVSLAQERTLWPCGAEPSGTFGPKLRALCGLVVDAKFDADPDADDDDGVLDGGPLPPDVVDGVAELKRARAHALWHLKSHIASAVVRSNKPILDRYLQLCRDRESESAEPSSDPMELVSDDLALDA